MGDLKESSNSQVYKFYEVFFYREIGLVAVATYIRTNQKPKDGGGAERRISLLGLMS
jgi:hypothetical protein